ncbi:MAG: hypothetical protein GY827_00915 [Cytophagales bacterium]|nr:hypothetical protein [Cytophagales bacterium]
MKNLKFTFFALFIFCASIFTFAQQYRQTASGLSFKIHKDEKGRTAKYGDLVSLHMVMSHKDAGILRNTYQQGKPLLFPVRFASAFEGDLTEAIKLLSKGDSASFLIQADSMYAKVFKKKLPKNIKGSSFLKFDIKVLNIMTQQEYLVYQKEQQTKYLQSHSAEIEARKKKEEALIQQYVKGRGFEFTRTKNGAYFTVVEEGKGKKIQKGQAVVFHYVGSLLNDETEFESTYTLGQPAVFTLGEGNVIPGWEEVFAELSEGDECKMIIPSHLAFRHIPKEKVPPHSVLIFDVKVITIK